MTSRTRKAYWPSSQQCLMSILCISYPPGLSPMHHTCFSPLQTVTYTISLTAIRLLAVAMWKAGWSNKCWVLVMLWSTFMSIFRQAQTANPPNESASITIWSQQISCFSSLIQTITPFGRLGTSVLALSNVWTLILAKSSTTPNRRPEIQSTAHRSMSSREECPGQKMSGVLGVSFSRSLCGSLRQMLGRSGGSRRQGIFSAKRIQIMHPSTGVRTWKASRISILLSWRSSILWKVCAGRQSSTLLFWPL